MATFSFINSNPERSKSPFSNGINYVLPVAYSYAYKRFNFADKLMEAFNLLHNRDNPSRQTLSQPERFSREK